MDFHKHVHSYNGKTSFVNNHDHVFMGVTSSPIEYQDSHIHDLWGITTYDANHMHGYKKETGPAIKLPDGSHTHRFEANTNRVEGHRHLMEGKVNPVEMEKVPE